MDIEFEYLQFGPQIYRNDSVIVYRGMYKGYDVAIKALQLSALLPYSAVMNEVRLQYLLQHPNICKVYGFAERTGCAYILIEWMEQDLEKVIRKRAEDKNPWSHRELWEYLLQMVDALAYAQEQGISHRDVKCANLLLNSRGELKIGDFGTSKQSAEVLTKSVVGSPYFMSPELKRNFLSASCGAKPQVEYCPYKSDVYSLGLTFLAMILLRMSPALVQLASLEEMTAQELNLVPEEFQELLAQMLSVKDRVDFIQLQSLLTYYPLGLTPAFCVICKRFSPSKTPSRLPSGVEPKSFCTAQCRDTYFQCYQQAARNGIFFAIEII